MTTQQILGGVAAAAAAMAAVCHAATFGGDPGEGIKYAGFALDLTAAGAGAFAAFVSTPARLLAESIRRDPVGHDVAMMKAGWSPPGETFSPPERRVAVGRRPRISGQEEK